MTAPAIRRPLVLASVMAGMFMIAIEATIVATAMPQIVGQLGGLRLYSWVFSAFLLTQTATTVLFGKLADLFGRRPVLLVGIAIFLVGSTLCGLAGTMLTLILFRAVQGVGAGAIQPVCMTVIGDLYSIEERGKIQGWLSSVWGVSSVIGPLAGGLIITHISWSWIFWINLPIGAAAMVGFGLYLREEIGHRTRRIDAPGAALFAIAIAALMVVFTELGTSGIPVIGAAVAVFVVSTGLFLLQERRAAEPMMALSLWGRRLIATTNLATLTSGMALIGLTAFLPMYVQGVLGQSALVAGFALTMMVLGWPIASTAAARSFRRFGLRTTLIAGAVLLPVGASVFTLLHAGLSPIVAGAGSFVMGLGMGSLSTSAIVLIQDSVGWSERGAATASNVFSRNLGSTLGATVLGGVLNLGLASQGDGSRFGQLRAMLDHPGTIGDPALRQALANALHLTFLAVFALAALTLLLALAVPSRAEQEEGKEVQGGAAPLDPPRGAAPRRG